MKESVPPRQIGSIAMSKGSWLGPISALIERKKMAVSVNQRNPSPKDWDKTFEDGTQANCRHVSCIASNGGLICEKRRYGDERAYPAK